LNITYIDRDLEKREQLEKLKKVKMKKRRFRLKILLYTVLILAILVSLALSPVCKVKRINVTGSTRYKDEQLIAATDIYIGGNSFKILFKNINQIKNIFSLRYGKSEQNILKNYPYIKEALIKYKIPNEISINIIERTPVCVVPYLGNYLLMGGEGYIVDTIDNPDKSKLPLVKGISFDSFVLGQALKAKAPQTIKDTLALLEAIKDSDKQDKFDLIDGIKVIDVNDTNKVYIFVDNRIEVNLGDLNDLNYKLNFLKQIYFKKLSKEDKGLIDFSTGENPDFVPEK
jgi:cell division protein FtsQ